MISNKAKNNRVANAVGARTARACDGCVKRRAKWYCAADDAFLCQSCDLSVHSANSLALRHQRVRLKTASVKNLDVISNKLDCFPSWDKGFTRKARTPRHNKLSSVSKVDEDGRNPIPLVPEVGCDEASHEENCEEDQLLFRVPTFEPFVAELCNDNPSTPISPNEGGTTTTTTTTKSPRDESTISLLTSSNGALHHGDSLPSFIPSNMDLADFAANVENLLGKAPFELSFEHEAPVSCEDGDEKVVCNGEIDLKNNCNEEVHDEDDEKMKRKKILLSLDYDAVISAWSSHGCSPWTNGERPDFDSDDCWTHCIGSWGAELQNSYRDGSMAGDGGREAKVWRYREKRRRRLFSKKIRYEVRKLNAQKRPRIKGRFVKRAAGHASPMIT